mmetsp:Transcript_26471/g.49977  ORF Transcript_26471/g.49977 Transcript_26471/m.49977 type:complete len:300 (-) Transcript_26471:123-1022(-)
MPDSPASECTVSETASPAASDYTVSATGTPQSDNTASDDEEHTQDDSGMHVNTQGPEKEVVSRRRTPSARALAAAENPSPPPKPTPKRRKRQAQDSDLEDEWDEPYADAEEVGFTNRRLTSRQRAMVGESQAQEFGESAEALDKAENRSRKVYVDHTSAAIRRAEKLEKQRADKQRANNAQQLSTLQRILTGDSTRQRRDLKREQKLRRREDEKKEGAQQVAVDHLRIVSRASGTSVRVNEDTELPAVFNAQPKRAYPPPRPTCAASSCTNTSRYRTSSQLHPVCSLECYRKLQLQHSN